MEPISAGVDRRAVPAGEARASAEGNVLATVSRAAVAARSAALTDVDPSAAVWEVIASTAEALAVPPSTLAAEVLDRALADPAFARVSPTLALQSYAVLIAGSTLAESVSLWRHDLAIGLQLMAQAGEPSERALERARALVTGNALEDERFAGAAVACHGVPSGAIVIELSQDDDPGRLRQIVEQAAARTALLFERVALLEHDDEHERALVGAAERRLARLGYDLHDGPMQGIVAVGAELHYLAADVERLVSEPALPAVRDGFASVMDQLRRLEAGLRAVARSSETSGVVADSLPRAIGRDLDHFTGTTSIVVRREIEDETPGLSDSQKIAVYRVLQEALSNIREHSGATEVEVSLRTVAGRAVLRVADNGRGFDVDVELERARERGRLGLVGMRERVRLLGGAVRIASSPGRGAELELALTPWLPSVAD